ncbi:Hypothetical predicted protein [Octopus vulgaris]|nr:Hypothetical predicted protein [Octopus vulgaris]
MNSSLYWRKRNQRYLTLITILSFNSVLFYSLTERCLTQLETMQSSTWPSMEYPSSLNACSVACC